MGPGPSFPIWALDHLCQRQYKTRFALSLPVAFILKSAIYSIDFGLRLLKYNLETGQIVDYYQFYLDLAKVQRMSTTFTTF
jgi:hypothetical protein